MRCEEIREKISMMTDGELSDEERSLVMEHLAACPDCMLLYEAFAAISDVLDTLEEPPAGFTEGVMDRIHAAQRRPSLRRRIMGFAGMAACLAVLLYAGNTMGWLHTGTTADSAAFTERSFAAADAETETMDVAPAAAESTTADAEMVYAKLMDYSEATLYAEADAGEEPAAPQAVTTQTMTPTANTAPVPALEDLLAVSAEAVYGSFDRTPDYTVTFSGDGETPACLLIWLDGDALYCEDPAAYTAWYAVGTAEEFLSVFAG